MDIIDDIVEIRYFSFFSLFLSHFPKISEFQYLTGVEVGCALT